MSSSGNIDPLSSANEMEVEPAYPPCIGCGYCCWKCVCSVGRNRGLRYSAAPCPLLVFHDGRHWCSVVEEAQGSYRELVCHNLSIGAGCCESMNSWRFEPIIDRTGWEEP